MSKQQDKAAGCLLFVILCLCAGLFVLIDIDKEKQRTQPTHIHE